MGRVQMQERLEQKLVETNCGLGQAINTCSAVGSP
jgi:hypothetical protein